ncbi:SMI1/KNR4 family protein [Ralstonia solanacearum]|uniref:SMI1/KNR4 family protein n=1 Tax=Ralstonia solanacearum TaxID=305 RepID=UPI0018D13F8D|nr:SMI1/KNR4 family protein [Ralstonia solanacearum]
MDIKRLNVNFGGRPSVGYGGRESAFKEMEQLTGGVIPSSYIDFIREADGGHPEIGSFTPLDGGEDKYFDVDLFYSFESGRGVNIKDALASWGGVVGKYALIIGRDGGGNQIYINLVGGGESVWIYLHDEGQARVRVANSFEEFIGMLRANPDFI